MVSISRAIAVVTACVLTACGPNPAAIRPDAGSAEYQVDAYQCDYESSSSTANYASGQPTARTYGGAIGQGIGAGIGQAMARNDLFVKCMRAKYAARAYSSPPSVAYEGKQMFPPPTASSAPQYPIVMSDPTGAVAPAARSGAAPAVAASINAESKWMIAAEGIAKTEGCVPPRTAMTSKGAGMEMFAVACPNGTTLAIRCEVDGCRVLR